MIFEKIKAEANGKIKKCPFCGGEAELYIGWHENSDTTQLKSKQKYCSRFIELPCKVGDVFYGIDTYGINAYSCYGIGYGYVSKNKIGFLLFTVGSREYIFGEEAFLTEAEAEQALKERES